MFGWYLIPQAFVFIIILLSKKQLKKLLDPMGPMIRVTSLVS
jgi:hypothetical protein